MRSVNNQTSDCTFKLVIKLLETIKWLETSFRIISPAHVHLQNPDYFKVKRAKIVVLIGINIHAD